MTFADRLEELTEASSKARWRASVFIESDNDETSRNIADLLIFLANNADAILELVRAAEDVKQWSLGRSGQPSQLFALKTALAKLNGEQT